MTSQQLRVVQLNLGSLFEPDWEKRRREVVAWLRRLQPDVICFEEVHESDSSPNTAGWIAEEFTAATGERWHWRFGGSDPVGTRTAPGTLFGIAILSRWPIDEFEYVRLPVDESVVSDSGVAVFPWGLVHASTAGLDVFAVHLTAAPKDARHRRVQVQYIDRYVKTVRGPLDVLGQVRSSMPPILCGDFNAEPDSDEIRFLCGLTSLGDTDTSWQDSWRVAGDGSPGYTQDWRDNSIASTMNIFRKRVDYVFVGDPFYRKGSGGRVLSAELAFHSPLTGIEASDHRGLAVDIVWPDRPEPDHTDTAR